MYHDELIEQTRAKPLGEQVWACDCRGGNEGTFIQITPNAEGECPQCSFYAKKILLSEITRAIKLRVQDPITEKELQFVKMRADMIPMNVIAHKLGIANSTASKWNKKHGCGIRKRNPLNVTYKTTARDNTKAGRPRDDRTVDVLKMRQEGYTYGNIAELLKMAPATVATICQREFKLGRYAK